MTPITKKWLELFRLLPGYDPVASAEDCEFDPRRAEVAIRFIAEQMTHVEGEKAGQSLTLEPWQQAVVGCVFGWKRPDGTRRYREVFQYVPRKNGKTTLMGALINLVAFCDNEPGAQIYSAASEREQAALVYRQAKGMVLANPELSSKSKPYVTFKSIEYPNAVVYKALSADADTKHGFNTHFVVVDELHAQPDRELVDVLITSTGSRRQPLVWYITTADFARDSICNEKLDYAMKVRDGVIQDRSFLPAIWAADKEADWKDPEVWRQANPNLGVSVSLEYLQRECQRAQEVPAYENTFKRLHLNIQTEQDVRAIPMDQWNDCGSTYTLDSLAGEACFAGLDLSSKVDVTALVLCFPGERWRLWPVFWVPEETAKMRERQNKTRFDEWIRRGHMQTTPGNSIDHAFIRRTINELSHKVRINKIAFDPWNAAQLSTELMEQDGFEVVEFRQGYQTMSEPTKMLLARLADKELEHPNNPCLNWMAANFSTDEDAAGNLKPSKKKSTEKIDGIVASIMAMGLAAVNHTDAPELIML
jgi:phage terminase large subunit-like protein